MRRHTPLRPVAVVLAATSAAGVAAAHLFGQLETDLNRGRGTVGDAVVQVCVLALLGCLAWAWLATCAVVVEAWRGAGAQSVPGIPLVVRRLVLTACGVALAGTLAAPAHADTGDHGSERPSLAGLPLPERAVGAAHPRPGPHRQVTVRPGDSLWAIAARDLPAAAGDAAITDRWHLIYRLNRAVVGPNPDLIHPGQALRLPIAPRPTR